jgi:hypothetical protein
MAKFTLKTVFSKKKTETETISFLIKLFQSVKHNKMTIKVSEIIAN